jgi:hypothetical protein
MNMQDGPGWSPDGGKFWVRDNVIYWESGEVTQLGPGVFFRTMPGGYDHDEDYSSLTDEQRAERLARYRAIKQIWDEKRKSQQDARDRLIESARSKLTTEECDACGI